jgi:hypothetical protein
VITPFRKIIWSILCGASLGLAGCDGCAPEPPGEEPVEKPARKAPSVIKTAPVRESVDKPARVRKKEVNEKEESELVDVYGPPRI